MRIWCALQSFCARKKVTAVDATITAVRRTVEDDHASS